MCSYASVTKSLSLSWSRFLDPEQLKKAQHLVKVHMATEKPSDNALMDGVTRYLRALREVATQHMLRKWVRGEWASIT